MPAVSRQAAVAFPAASIATSIWSELAPRFSPTNGIAVQAPPGGRNAPSTSSPAALFQIATASPAGEMATCGLKRVPPTDGSVAAGGRVGEGRGRRRGGDGEEDGGGDEQGAGVHTRRT